MLAKKTVIVTGAQQGIGAGLVEGFLKHGYNVVATSLHASKSLSPKSNLIVIDGDIRDRETAAKCVNAAVTHFGEVEVLVNNAGIFMTKPFTEFTIEDFNSLVSINLLGFLHMTQLAVQQMLKQESGCVITISAALAENPIAGVNASVSMITKGGLNTVTRHLAIEYAKRGIRFNAVAPGVVNTALHQENSQRACPARYSRLRNVVEINDIFDAVLYLAHARQVTGEVLHVAGGTNGGQR